LKRSTVKKSKGESVAEREILGDSIDVRGMNGGGFAQAANAMGVFGLGQMAAAGAEAQRLAGGGEFEPLGHGLFRLNAFGTSHNLFKREGIIRPGCVESSQKKNKYRCR
jgi:hypothetical protein